MKVHLLETGPDGLWSLIKLLRLDELLDIRAIFKEGRVAAFVFAKGVIPVKELAQAINTVTTSQNHKLRGIGDCLRVEERVVAVIHEKTVPESVIFVDKEVNRPYIEAAREVAFLREFK